MEDGKNFDASSSWFATNVRAAEKDAPAAEKFAKRIQLVEDATALKEPERIPMCPMLGALPYNLEGSSYKAAMYDFPAASEALVKFYQEFQPAPVFLIFPPIRLLRMNIWTTANIRNC